MPAKSGPPKKDPTAGIVNLPVAALESWRGLCTNGRNSAECEVQLDELLRLKTAPAQLRGVKELGEALSEALCGSADADLAELVLPLCGMLVELLFVPHPFAFHSQVKQCLAPPGLMPALAAPLRAAMRARIELSLLERTSLWPDHDGAFRDGPLPGWLPMLHDVPVAASLLCEAAPRALRVISRTLADAADAAEAEPSAAQAALAHEVCAVVPIQLRALAPWLRAQEVYGRVRAELGGGRTVEGGTRRVNEPECSPASPRGGGEAIGAAVSRAAASLARAQQEPPGQPASAEALLVSAVDSIFTLLTNSHRLMRIGGAAGQAALASDGAPAEPSDVRLAASHLPRTFPEPSPNLPQVRLAASHLHFSCLCLFLPPPAAAVQIQRALVQATAAGEGCLAATLRGAAQAASYAVLTAPLPPSPGDTPGGGSGEGETGPASLLSGALGGGVLELCASSTVPATKLCARAPHT
jgi:hypothetical protein